MTTISDDALIEVMARAMFKDDQLNRLDIAKAALAVARPVIERETRERCAKIAETPEIWVTNKGNRGCDDIAAAIRSGGE